MSQALTGRARLAGTLCKFSGLLGKFRNPRSYATQSLVATVLVHVTLSVYNVQIINIFLCMIFQSTCEQSGITSKIHSLASFKSNVQSPCWIFMPSSAAAVCNCCKTASWIIIRKIVRMIFYNAYRVSFVLAAHSSIFCLHKEFQTQLVSLLP